MSETLNLSLSLPEINTVLQALSAAPYAQVADLIAKIQMQAQAQLQTEGGKE